MHKTGYRKRESWRKEELSHNDSTLLFGLGKSMAGTKTGL